MCLYIMCKGCIKTFCRTGKGEVDLIQDGLSRRSILRKYTWNKDKLQTITGLGRQRAIWAL